MRNFALVAALCLLGCAATGYDLSDRAVKYRGSLTEAQAYQELQKFMFKSPAQAGVCGAHTVAQFQEAIPTGVKPPLITFDGWVTEVTGMVSKPGAAAGTISTTTYGRPVKKAFHVDVTRLDKIRVQTEVKGLCGQYAGPLAEYVVTIDNKGVANTLKGEANALMINVSKDNLDYLLAVLTFLSPNARIIQGAGL